MQPVDQLGQGDVAGDGQVVEQGEGENGVGAGPVEEGGPLAAPPAEAGRGVGQVEIGGQDLAVALLAQRPVEAVEDKVVAVGADHVVGVAGGHPRVGPVVAAQVEDQPGPLPSSDLATKAALISRSASV